MIQRHPLMIPAPARSNLTSVYVRFDCLGAGTMTVLLGGGTLVEVTNVPATTDAVAVFDFRTERLAPDFVRVITTVTISMPSQPAQIIPNYSEIRLASGVEAALVTDFITDNIHVHLTQLIG